MNSLDLAIAVLKDPQASEQAKQLAEAVIREGQRVPSQVTSPRWPYDSQDKRNPLSPPFKVTCQRVFGPW